MQFKFYLILTPIILFAKLSFCQNISGLDSLKGTYQIQIKGNLRTQVDLPITLAQSIKANRKAKQTSYIYIQSNVRVKILSDSTITCQGFIGLPVQTIVPEFQD